MYINILSPTRVFILTSPSSVASATCSLEILAGSMASLGLGSGRACGNPNESHSNTFPKPKCLTYPHIRCHMWQALSPFLGLSTGSYRHVPKSTAKHCAFTARTGLQHHRGVNCKDLHGVANVGILEGHGGHNLKEPFRLIASIIYEHRTLCPGQPR